MRKILPQCAALLVLFCFLQSTVFAQVTPVWVSRYNGPENLFDGAYSLAVTDGNVYVTGQTVSAARESDFLTIKYDANGNILWASTFNSIYNLDDGATSIAVDGSRNVYVTGWSNVTVNSQAFTTIKYDPNGKELWARHHQGTGNFRNQANSLGLDGSGNVYLTGVSTGIGSGDDFATISYDAAGNLRWLSKYDGPANLDDYPHSLAVSSSGNVYITGRTVRVPGNPDFVTIKYNANGILQWLSRYDGLASSSDVARDIALDANEDVFITGETFTAADYDVTTIKYEGTTGRALWASRYNGPQNFRDQGIALALDTQGDVYVTGISYDNMLSGADYLTIRYNGVIGRQEWVRRYNGPANSNDQASSIAVDNAGNSYITGVSVGTSNEDYATVAYDKNGNQRWVERYNGLGNSNDWAHSVAVDLSGNVYVTGRSPGIGTGDDVATIKYSQPLPLKVNAGNDTTVYLGYSSTCVNLTAQASDGTPPYSYEWSAGVATASQITVCPTATTTYNITITDALGFSASDQVMVTVIDVRCSENKVLVCHNGQGLCVAANAVAVHLKHGDGLGKCLSPEIETGNSEMVINIDNTPNPFSTTTRIQYDIPEDGKVLIKVFDEMGREVLELVNAQRKAGVYSVDFNASALDKRIFFYRVMLSTKNRIFVKTGKMLKIK